jgi:hypothetical protein|tara:strand:+ start:19 stop:276 length:258 start_codon:yes stop_codon:yes gene_type:complete
MKKKESEIFHQALGEATHKPTMDWEREIAKAEQVKFRRETKTQIVSQIESLSEGIDWSYENLLRRTNIMNLQNILQLLKIRNTLK